MFFAHKKLMLFILLLVAFIDYMGIGLVYPMFSSMLFHRDIDLLSPETSDTVRGFWLGILLAMMAVAQFFSSPIIGTMSDQKGRKPLLKIALTVGVLGYLISMIGVWVESLVFLLLSRLVLGISAGSAAVVGASLADLSQPEEKAKNFGLLNMACGIGFSVGPFFGGVLSEFGLWGMGGYDKPFLFAGILTFLNFRILRLKLRYFDSTYCQSCQTPCHSLLFFTISRLVHFDLTSPSSEKLFMGIFAFTAFLSSLVVSHSSGNGLQLGERRCSRRDDGYFAICASGSICLKSTSFWNYSRLECRHANPCRRRSDASRGISVGIWREKRHS